MGMGGAAPVRAGPALDALRREPRMQRRVTSRSATATASRRPSLWTSREPGSRQARPGHSHTQGRLAGGVTDATRVSTGPNGGLVPPHPA